VGLEPVVDRWHRETRTNGVASTGNSDLEWPLKGFLGETGNPGAHVLGRIRAGRRDLPRQFGTPEPWRILTTRRSTSIRCRRESSSLTRQIFVEILRPFPKYRIAACTGMALRRRSSRVLSITIGGAGIAVALALLLGTSLSDGTALAATDSHCEAFVQTGAATCPVLSTSYGSEPGGWSRAANSAWTSDGKPVFFFYSSLACPYCASSSWVLWFGLAQFGNWSGLAFSQSMPSPQIFPNTSSVDFANATYSSSWVVPDFWVGNSTTSIQFPALECPESAYESAYDSEGIPFLVINGQFFEAGGLNSPSEFRENSSNESSDPLSASAVLGEFENQSGPAWQDSSGQIGLVEAEIVVADGGRGPPSVLSNATVQQDIRSMTAPPPPNFPFVVLIAGSGLGALGTYFGAAFAVRRRARSKEEKAEARNPFRVASIALGASEKQVPGAPADAGAGSRERSNDMRTPPTPSAEAPDDPMADLV
jgi:Domain of unknown function (DUF929)